MFETTTFLETPQPTTATGQWHVLHIKSRQEKIVAGALSARSIAYYLPLLREVRFHGGRRVVVEQPVFPSYLFLHGQIEDAYGVDRAGRVAGIIRVHDQAQFDREISGIRHAIDSGLVLQPHPFFTKGTRVSVRHGPLQGLHGVVEGDAARGRLVLRLTTLGRAVSVDIDPSFLEAD